MQVTSWMRNSNLSGLARMLEWQIGAAVVWRHNRNRDASNLDLLVEVIVVLKLLQINLPKGQHIHKAFFRIKKGESVQIILVEVCQHL